MKKITVILLSVGFLAFGALAYSGHVQADDARSWEEAKKNLDGLYAQKLPEEEECQIIWDTLWTWAKKGDLDARLNLFKAVYLGWPGLPQIVLPGRSGDGVSYKRDGVILGLYSLEAQPDKIMEKGISELLDSSDVGGEYFLECLKRDTTKQCVHKAYTEFSLIPSFEKYAAEIDALQAGGMKQKCLHFRDGPWVKHR